MGVAVVSSEDLGTVVGAGGSLSMLDKKLLRYASSRMTPEQMSEALEGILSPAAAAQRVREILRSWDWLAIVEQKALILMDMIELKDILMSRVKAEGGFIEDEKTGQQAYSFGDPRWASALQKTLDSMNKLVSTQQASLDAERQGLRKAHAMVMVRALEMGFDKLSRELRREYPQVNEQRMRDVLEDVLPLAIATVDAAVSEEDQIEDSAGGF